MARLVQDQNMNIHSAAMLDGLKTSKKGAFGGRKALNDISNSSKLSANVVSKGKDFITAPGVAALGNVDKVSKSKAPTKGQPSGGRKALGDLTNTNFARSSAQNGLNKKVQGKTLSGIMEDTIPCDFKDEQFLHNHEECIKVQRKGMEFKHFLETVGLGSPLLVPPHATFSQAESPVKINMEEKEIPEFGNIDQIWTVYSSPVRDSQKSMTTLYDNWKIADDDETFVEFKLIESPKLRNYLRNI